MTASRAHKLGDSIRLTAEVKNSDGSSVNFTGYKIEVKCTNKQNGTVAFNINTVSVDSNMYITSNELNIGKYSIIVRDTSMLKTGEYFVDITYVSADGFRQSIETINLKVMDRI